MPNLLIDPIVSAILRTTAAYLGLPLNSLNADQHQHSIESKPVIRAKTDCGVLRVSRPTEIKSLPTQLRESLIGEMAAHFTALWGNTDPSLSTYETSTQTLSALADHPSAVFLVQHDAEGKLVCTASIAERDVPAFRQTGPQGSDRYGDHWIVNVFSVHRGLGFATEQIRWLQKIARARGWPHLWLYCRDEQNGISLPAFYRNKLGFKIVGHEYVIEGDRVEKESIMRFDTRLLDALQADRWAGARVSARSAPARRRRLAWLPDFKAR